MTSNKDEQRPEGNVSTSECEEFRSERQNSDISYVELGEKFGIEPEVVAYHTVGQCSCDSTVEALSSDKPWTEKSLLEYLVIDKNLDFKVIGDYLGCHQETVKNWAGEERFDIMIIESDERVSSADVRKPLRKGKLRDDDPETTLVDKIVEQKEKEDGLTPRERVSKENN